MLRNIMGVVVGVIVGFVAVMMFFSVIPWLFPDRVSVEMTKQEGFKGFFFVWLLGAKALMTSVGQAIQVVVGGLVASKVGKAAPWVLVSAVGTLTAMFWLAMYSLMGAYTHYHGSPWLILELLLYPPVIWRTIRHVKRVRGALAAATVEAGPT